MASIIILVENGGGGGRIAAPIARIAFEHLFKKNIENSLAVK
jgi:cell division protein FtsI/penicillin-binding protein 2